MADSVLLKVEGVSRRFGGVRAVDGVSFEVRAGEALGIIGPNGSGKSTLINLLSGFVRPDGGRVYFKGRDITYLAPERRVGLGIVRSFQMPRPFYNLPAYKNLIIPLFSARARSRQVGRMGDRDEVAIHLLEDVGFERDSQVPFKTAGALPHGYLKRLELARCLALEPELLLLDELFSGMSMSEVASILPLLERILDEGCTLILVEHRLSELFRIVRRVVVLDFGRKIAEGHPQEILQMPAVRSAYLGSDAGNDA